MSAPLKPAGEHSRVARLRILYKDGSQQSVQLTEKITTLGRTPANKIQLKDGSASRKHCLIKLEAGQYMLSDLGSGNGTSVNGGRVKEHYLSDGDRIQIGTTTLQFVDDETERPL
jgi:pSer/pThr/pTyr-binding forkhead associated (FHA) protein